MDQHGLLVQLSRNFDCLALIRLGAFRIVQLENLARCIAQSVLVSGLDYSSRERLGLGLLLVGCLG